MDEGEGMGVARNSQADLRMDLARHFRGVHDAKMRLCYSPGETS